VADRYWVGGTAAWDGTAGTKWALTSGGAGGQAVPTSADDVFFDGNSGASTVTISSGNTGAKSINCTGFTGTLAGAAAITVSGSVTFVAGMTLTYSGTYTLNGTGTLTSGGKTLQAAVTINGAGITVTLGDALTITGANALAITQGTFDTANYNVTGYSLVSSNSNTRTINLGSSTITLSLGGGSGALQLGTITNLTFNAGTSTIDLTNNDSIIASGGLTFYNVIFSSSSSLGGVKQVRGANTFNNLSTAAPSTAGYFEFTFNAPQTINGTLSTTGTAGNRRVWFRSATHGVAQTLTINSAPSLTDADFRDIYVVGTSAPISGTRIGDLRGCRGITFSTPKTVYWNLAGAQNWSANGWSDTSTGTPNTNFFPLAQDTATFTNAGSVTGTITMNSAVPYTGTVDMSGRTSAMTLAIGAGFTIYGDWKNGSGTTLSGSGILTYSGRNTQTITSAGKTFTGSITVDSYGGSVELADALNIGINSFTVTNGTFDTKNFNVTGFDLSSNNSNVRAITLGSSTVTLGGSSAIVFTTATNLTFNAGTSQITLTTTATVIFDGGGLTFYNVSFTGTTAVTRSITGSNTFNNLTFTAPASAGLMGCTFNANQTITGTLTVAGASPVRRIFVRSNTLGTTRTLTVGTLSATDCDFRDITIAGAAAGSSPTRAGDCGGNSGITFPGAKTVYWNLAGTQNWSATGWCPTSGGTPDINQFPLAQDTAVFDNTGSVTGTITIDTAWNIGTFNASARTSAMTLTTGSTAPFVYGDWLFGTGVTSSSTTGTITFAKRGTQTITSNGVQFGCPVTIDCATGTVNLADALSLGSTRTLTLTSGTFDAVTYNVTAGLVSFANSNIRTLKLGSGTWTISGTGSIWSAFTTTNLVFLKGSANIVLSDTSTSARTFSGGSLSYNKLTIGGTTGTSTTTINDNNQFTELASTKTVAHTIALGSTTQTFGKWTVTGTVGNLVTLTGSGTSHVLAGACTSGIDYIQMGSIGFAATSPGEFYAGANSTGSAGAPVYRTAKPADSTRYWVGGTGNWSDTARWSTGSGGGSGASVPRSHDDVVFDSASNATAYTATVNAVTGGIRMKSLTIAGPATGNVTLAGSTAMVGIHGNVTLPATGLTRTYTGNMTLSGSSTGRTFTTNGVALASAITVNGVDCGWSLGSALDIQLLTLTVTNGSFDLATYNLIVGLLESDNGNSRVINLNAGTTTLTNSTCLNFGTTETNRANLTFTASTSQLTCNSTNPTFSGNNQTFYNVSFTSTSSGATVINGTNSFNNLSFSGLTSLGINQITLTANQTITGTLTFSAGTDATYRRFIRSDVIGTTRTLTVAAFSGTDVDFRDIAVTGAAAPISGTRLGDVKGNSGITFPSPKTVYVRSTGSAAWDSSTGWSATEGGTADITQFPLAQDTVIFPAATYPASGSTITISRAYNLGTIDMSLRTSNTVTLAMTSTFTNLVCGNLINGTGTTLSGTASLTFAGRGSQTITSAGKTFTQSFIIDSPGGSVTLQDAFVCDRNAAGAITVTTGTFDANGYNVTLSGAFSSVATSGTGTRTIAVGSGTLAISGTGGWNAATSTNLTVTGTGTISLTSASAKTFEGGGIAYTNITLNQGGNGTLAISGNNTFKTISSTAAGANIINIGTTTQRVTTSWTATGTVGNVLTVTGTSGSSPGTLVFTGSGTAANVDYLTITGVRAYNLTDTWYAGANSTNNGSLGWYFNVAPAPGTATSNFFLFF